MQRRKFILGLGAAAASGAAVLGSGAFTSVEADRNVTVEVEDDHSAFLVLDEIDSGERAKLDGGKLKFELPGGDEGDYPKGIETDPEGLGSDSIYRFGSDAGGDGPGLFEVKNQGTQEVEIFSTQDEKSDVPSVTMFNVETSNLLTEEDPSDSVGVGENLLAGLEIDTHGVDVESYDLTLTINAVDLTE